jgi:hypothetical protein
VGGRVDDHDGGAGGGTANSTITYTNTSISRAHTLICLVRTASVSGGIVSEASVVCWLVVHIVVVAVSNVVAGMSAVLQVRRHRMARLVAVAADVRKRPGPSTPRGKAPSTTRTAMQCKNGPAEVLWRTQCALTLAHYTTATTTMQRGQLQSNEMNLECTARNVHGQTRSGLAPAHRCGNDIVTEMFSSCVDGETLKIGRTGGHCSLGVLRPLLTVAGRTLRHNGLTRPCGNPPRMESRERTAATTKLFIGPSAISTGFGPV